MKHTLSLNISCALSQMKQDDQNKIKYSSNYNVRSQYISEMGLFRCTARLSVYHSGDCNPVRTSKITRFQFRLCWVAFFGPAGYLRGSLHTQTVVTVVPRWPIVSQPLLTLVSCIFLCTTPS